MLTGPSPLLMVKKTQWQSWRGFTQGHQLLCWPRRLLSPGFALEGVHLGFWQCGILGEPQVAAVLMAERPTGLLVRGCSPHPSWKPSGAGAPLGAGSVLDPIARESTPIWYECVREQASFCVLSECCSLCAGTVTVPQAALGTALPSRLFGLM